MNEILLLTFAVMAAAASVIGYRLGHRHGEAEGWNEGREYQISLGQPRNQRGQFTHRAKFGKLHLQ